MEYRTLGRSGAQVGVLSLGTMMFAANGDYRDCERMVHAALDAGVNLFDTADGYGSEDWLGRALRSSRRRDRAIVATKCFFPRSRTDPNRRGGSRRWIMQACDDSLARLALDHIDLYQLHRLDHAVDWAESLGALDDLVRAGKVRMIGTSGAAAHEIIELLWVASDGRLVKPTSEQPQYSVFTRASEAALLPACQRHRVGTIVYGPLNGGWLTGKYSRDAQPPEDSRAARRFYRSEWWDRSRDAVQRKLDLVDPLSAVASDAGLDLTGLALAFVLAHPGVTSALIGPRTSLQLSNLLDRAYVRLSNDVLDSIDRLVAPGTDIDPTDFVTVG